MFLKCSAYALLTNVVSCLSVRVSIHKTHIFEPSFIPIMPMLEHNTHITKQHFKHRAPINIQLINSHFHTHNHKHHINIWNTQNPNIGQSFNRTLLLKDITESINGSNANGCKFPSRRWKVWDPHIESLNCRKNYVKEVI